MKVIALASAALLTTVSWANTYYSVSDIDFLRVESGSESSNGFALSSIYYFDGQKALGPLDEFSYLNADTQVYGSYLNFESGDVYSGTLGGDLVIDQFLVGASYSDNKAGIDTMTAKFGYLVLDNFLVQVEAIDIDTVGTDYLLSASYDHSINATDYLGFTITTDDEVDSLSMSSRYFTHLGGDRYFAADIAIADSDVDSSWTVKGSYYTSKRTSFSLGLGDDSLYSIGAKHFFNDNVAVKVSLQSESNESPGAADTELLQMGVRAQF